VGTFTIPLGEIMQSIKAEQISIVEKGKAFVVRLKAILDG
jgi:hypothetical protein